MYGASVQLLTWDWFDFAGSVGVFSIGIQLDMVAATISLVVLLVSFLVHLYSLEYMRGDTAYGRYFAFLGLFTFSMLGIVFTNNLLILFVFWELVGFSSYLLIGFWFEKNSASAAAKKAFILNRIADLGFLVALMIVWNLFGTFDLNAIKASVSELVFSNNFITLPSSGLSLSSGWLTVLGLGLFLGAVGKSAQFPLQIWLPDAMEGPTPVSALIHAATMVAAGVYMLFRVSFLLTSDVMFVIALIGAVTAFMGAIAAITQNDIKKVLAYSTISQLGYMMIGIGVDAKEVALFHLITHAFFKAGLFLSAGSVIFALHKALHKNESINPDQGIDPQDMRLMGGLRKKMPITFICFTICALSLVGLPLFSGFLSKDAILLWAIGWTSMEGSIIAYLIPTLGFVSVLFTAIYMGRQILLVFFGDFRLQKRFLSVNSVFENIQESSKLITIPLIALSTLCIGWLFSANPFNIESSWLVKIFEGGREGYLFLLLETFDRNHFDILLAAIQENHTLVSIVSTGLALIGLALAFRFFSSQAKYTQNYHTHNPSGFLERVSFNNWYLDAIYKNTILKVFSGCVAVAEWLDRRIIDKLVNYSGIASVVWANITAWFDRSFVDGAVSLLTYSVGKVGNKTRAIQGGKIQSYIIFTTAVFVFLLILAVWFS